MVHLFLFVFFHHKSILSGFKIKLNSMLLFCIHAVLSCCVSKQLFSYPYSYFVSIQLISYIYSYFVYIQLISYPYSYFVSMQLFCIHTVVFCISSVVFVSIHFRAGNLTADRYLKMYDIRMMRAMSPMQLVIDPTFLRFVPTYSSRIAVVSQVKCTLRDESEKILIAIE